MTDKVEEALGRVSTTHPVDAETIREYIAQQEAQLEAQFGGIVPERAMDAPEDLSPAAVKLARRVQALPDDAVYVIVLFKYGKELVYVVNREGKLERAN